MDGLIVKGISKVYGSTTVVDNISFQAAQGKILGVLGPNGAGKTTIIRMIMGITAPDQGEIFFQEGGKRTRGVPLNLVGYLPEERGLYKETKVMNILLFLAGLKDMPKQSAKERAMEWLRKFGLEEYANKKVEQLSKGMAQKVQFIASILHEPKFVVLDEPFWAWTRSVRTSSKRKYGHLPPQVRQCSSPATKWALWKSSVMRFS